MSEYGKCGGNKKEDGSGLVHNGGNISGGGMDTEGGKGKQVDTFVIADGNGESVIIGEVHGGGA